MTNKILYLITTALLTVVCSCSKHNAEDNWKHIYIPRNIPSITIESIKYNAPYITLIGTCSSSEVPECDYYFLCSTDKNDFSQAKRISAEHYYDKKYRTNFKPDSEGVFHFRFCADNKGLSYIESKTGDFEYISVTSLSIDPPSTSIGTDIALKLNAIVQPSNASDKSVIWKSSSTSIAKVNSDGIISCVSPGDVEITATTSDAGITAKCKLTVTEPVLTAVDLGLSVKWANFNLAASKLEYVGGEYQWAGTEKVSSTTSTGCPYRSGNGWTKYVPSSGTSYWSGSGNPDNKTVLEPMDDAAHVTLGGKWRMPTDEEWRELSNNCEKKWEFVNGKSGYRIISKVPGYTHCSIFLPAVHVYSLSSYGEYWSSSLYLTNPNKAYNIWYSDSYSSLFGSDFRVSYYSDRSAALPIRPVCDK